MQNYNNPSQPPQGGYGMQPPKNGMSTGVKVLIVVAVLLVVGVAVLVAVGIGGAYWLTKNMEAARGPEAGSRPTSSSSSSSSSSSTAGDDAQPPQPTSEQAAAIAGGQSAVWSQQEISWTVPQRWKQDSASSTSFNWSSPGSGDAAFLLVNISPMSADFPADISIKAFYDQAAARKQRGEVNEVRWLKLDGVKGVMFREAAPETSDSPQRLQWMGYRNYKGQTQLVNIILSSSGKHFTQHEDALYGILYSTKLTH